MARAWVFALVAALTAAPAFASLEEALQAAAVNRWDEAATEARRAGGTAPDIVEWQRLRARQGGAAFADYATFLADHPDWPGLPLLRKRGEETLDARVTAPAVLDYFAADLPQTANGAYWLALGQSGAGRAQEARDTLVRAWTTLPFSPEEEALYLARYRELLAPYHTARMQDVLWRGGWGEADRMKALVPAGWAALADARRGLRQDAPGVDGLINRVPAELLSDPGLAFDRFAWRMRRERWVEAAELIRAQSQKPATLGRPEAWADLRGRLARQLMRDDNHRLAYLVASTHQLTTGEDYADLEWLSGYLALRYLDSAGAALDHFQRMRGAVTSPISLGRAGYWEGRAYEALDEPEQARAAYAFGALYQTSFYGQLAAERGGIAPDPLLAGTEEFPEGTHAAFRRSSVYQAGVALFEAGDLVQAARFLAHLTESMDREEIGTMAARLDVLDSPHLQLEIGKRAAAAGHALHKAYFPLMKMEARAAPDVEPELALAIARRESEFNPQVISGAGARGLMQLMPGTAQAMAKALGEKYDLVRLTRDPGYNARLGTAYLQNLRNRFGASTVLVAAGYNAGPGRPLEWIDRYGDPRAPSVDPVDWIEHIPFTETRNYVMRVMESLAPYRARLAGKVGPLGLTEALHAR